MIWLPPKSEHAYLYLPMLPKSGIIEENTPLFKASDTLCIPVNSDFLSAWHDPIKNTKDAVTLNKRLAILGEGFNGLVKAGRGMVSCYTKEHPADFVTDMDRGIEALMRIWLRQHYPHHKIIGEEGQKESFNLNDYVWFLDPIDGTGNFVQNSNDVAIHLACLYQGLPFATFFGLPFYDEFYTLYHKSPTVNATSNRVIGTEYMPQKNREAAEYKALLLQLSAQEHRVKSIGLHLYHLMQGRVSAFFKPDVKLWDIIAPCSLMQHYAPTEFHIEIIYENGQCVSLFNENSNYWQYVNRMHQKDCRIGFFMVTRPDDTELRHILKSKA